MQRFSAREGIPLEVRDAPLHAILAESRAALVTSGTATLECALLRTPSVVLYAVDGFSLRASRFVLTSPFIALPNLLRGRTVFPEHLAARDPSEAVARDLAALWSDGPERSRCLLELDALREAMLAPGAAARAADAIVAQLR
jgi:lipid-A-disaccharide synthase